jgi:putative ABC transport system permease protein
MFFTYLRRQLFNRKRQTIIVSLGLALGVALVFTVSAVSNGVQQS